MEASGARDAAHRYGHPPKSLSDPLLPQQKGKGCLPRIELETTQIEKEVKKKNLENKDRQVCETT